MTRKMTLACCLMAVVFIFQGRVEGEILNDDDQKAIVDAHNEYRRGENADNMNLIKWDDTLAKKADDYSELCSFDHGGLDTDGTPFSTIGQNIYLTKPQKKIIPKGPVTSWMSEKANYKFETQECNGVCGHYTQLVWADSIFVGCAVRNCSTVKPNNVVGATLVYCNYGPGGNYPDTDPYVKSDAPCAMCQDGVACVDGLCDADYE